MKSTEASPRHLLRHTVVLGASIAMLGVSIAACGGSSSEESSSTGSIVGTTEGEPPGAPTGTLKWGLSAAPISLDPALGGDSGNTHVSTQISETLVRRNEDNTDFLPWLVTSFEVSDDARVWTGEIRPNVTFHDGATFDSTAVRKTLEHYASSEGLGALLLPEFSRIDDSDPDVIRLVTKDPAPDLTRALTFVFMMSPKQLAAGKDALSERQVGTGPFRFVSKTPTEIILDASPDYWSDGPHVERLEMAVMPDLSAQVNALKSGSLDFVTEVPPPQAALLDDDPNLQVLSNANSQQITYLITKTQVPPMGDLEMRQAVAYALDRETLADAILKGRAEPADRFEPRANYGSTPMEPQYPYDPEEAQSLVEGYAGGRPQIKMAYIAGQDETLAQAVAEELRTVGFEVSADALEEGIYQSEQSDPTPPHNLMLNRYTWIGGGTLVYNLGLFTTLSNFDTTGPKDVLSKVDSLTAKIQTVPDGAEREDAIQELQNLLAEHLPHVPIVSQHITDVLSDRVQGYTNSGNGLIDLRPVYLSP